MKKDFMQNIKAMLAGKKFKYGGYAIVLTLLVIGLVAALNIGLTALEGNFDLRIDMSQNKMFSLSDQTQKIVKAVDKDIYIYTLYTPGQEDKDVQEVLHKFRGLNSHIIIENRDPDKDPRFMQSFTKTGEQVAVQSVIVTDADRKLYKVLSSDTDLYQTEYDQQTYQAYHTQNKTEGAVTQAINYIVSGYIPMAYVAEGHGELALSDVTAATTQLEANNYKVESVDIAKTPEKVKAGDIIMFFNPQTDLQDSERDFLKGLMDKGGRFYFMFDPIKTDFKKLPNFMSLLQLYDISLKQGMIFENDPMFTITQNAGFLVPQIQSHASTDSIIAARTPIVIPYGGALKLPDVAPESTMTITSLLKTSAKSYLKVVDVNNQNQDITQKEGDEVGPFDVAVAVQKKVGSNAADDVRFIVVYNTNFATAASLANTTADFDFFLNTSAWMRNADKDIYVRPKTLSNPQLIFRSQFEQYAILIVSCLLVPLLLFAAGVFVYLKRKHL